MENGAQPIHPIQGGWSGLTKREYFAGLILPPLLSRTTINYTMKDAVSDAVIVADLLLKELNK